MMVSYIIYYLVHLGEYPTAPLREIVVRHFCSVYHLFLEVSAGPLSIHPIVTEYQRSTLCRQRRALCHFLGPSSYAIFRLYPTWNVNAVTIPSNSRWSSNLKRTPMTIGSKCRRFIAQWNPIQFPLYQSWPVLASTHIVSFDGGKILSPVPTHSSKVRRILFAGSPW